MGSRARRARLLGLGGVAYGEGTNSAPRRGRAAAAAAISRPTPRRPARPRRSPARPPRRDPAGRHRVRPAAAGRLELLARPVDLLGEVAGDLVAASTARAAAASSAEQRSGLPSRSRSQQRVWKWQPDGGLTGDGTSPLRMIRRRRRSTSGSGIGTADSSATVYGWSGRELSSRDGASSTIRPRYITAIRSLMWRTTRQVVGDEQVGQPEPVLEPLEQVDDLGLDRHVERARSARRRRSGRGRGRAPGRRRCAAAGRPRTRAGSGSA